MRRRPRRRRRPSSRGRTASSPNRSVAGPVPARSPASELGLRDPGRSRSHPARAAARPDRSCSRSQSRFVFPPLAARRNDEPRVFPIRHNWVKHVHDQRLERAPRSSAPADAPGRATNDRRPGAARPGAAVECPGSPRAADSAPARTAAGTRSERAVALARRPTRVANRPRASQGGASHVCISAPSVNQRPSPGAVAREPSTESLAISTTDGARTSAPKPKAPRKAGLSDGRGGRIRTCDLPAPSRTR